ncbi:MAG: tetratricopeptide repeat protein, partial [Ruminiclostridium sp.]
MKKPVKIAIILSIIAVIIAASAIVGTSIYRSSPNYLLSAAERYLTEMNYEEAIIAFEKYLEIEPRDAEAWLKLADAYYQSGNLDKAIETLEKALTFVEDERIRAKLAEYMLEKYPPVTTTTAAATTAPKEEPPQTTADTAATT